MSFDREHEKIKSILIISHSYKPLLNPRAFRWSAVAEEFIARNIRVDVVTSWQSGQLRKENINGVNVYRPGGAIIEILRGCLSSPHKKTTAAVSEKSGSQTNSRIDSFIRRGLHHLHDSTWKRLYWPDYACLWIKAAIKQAIALLGENSYDAMYTVSDPFSSHLVGLNIKKRWPELFWLVDIGDPFCFRHDTPTNNHRIYRKLNYKVEANVFKAAGKITVTTESTKAKYAELFPDSAGKIEVIPPVMNDFSISGTSVKVLGQNNRIKLVYVGTLYRAIRNPKFLLRLFDELTETNLKGRIELHFFGGLNDCHDIFKPHLESRAGSLFLHGLVERQKVMRALTEADILINIGNDNPYQLPSKVVEYAASGRPILNIARTKEDTSAEFLKSYPGYLNILEEPSGPSSDQLEMIRDFISKKQSRVDGTFLKTFLMPYHIGSITSSYQALSLSGGESRHVAASFVGHNSCI